MNIIRETLITLHHYLVSNRRVQILAELLNQAIPHGAKVLDVGAGDGTIDVLIQEQRPDIQITAVDTLIRNSGKIPIEKFNGRDLPFEKDSFDVVMFVDVLHHTMNPAILIQEAKRVSRKYILIKDHCREGILANNTLKFMDFVGNWGHGVALPYNYLNSKDWTQLFQEFDLKVELEHSIRLYPFPARLLFKDHYQTFKKVSVIKEL